MAPRKKQIEEALKELAAAHTQLTEARESHLGKGDGSEIVLTMFDQKICELEAEITVAAKALFNRGEAPDKS
jgi:hypothetical protein